MGNKKLNIHEPNQRQSLNLTRGSKATQFNRITNLWGRHPNKEIKLVLTFLGRYFN